MARRRIGQEQLRFDPPQSRQSGSLDEITGLIGLLLGTSAFLQST
jgi:hypothetical protein